MIFTDEIKDWLPWVIKIRFVIIVFVFAIDYSIHQLDLILPTPPPSVIWAWRSFSG